MMAAGALDDDRDVLQKTTGTVRERYPWIFDALPFACPDARHILCYGCSTGVEMLALRARFPSARIVGIDVNPDVLAEARARSNYDGNMEVYDGTSGLAAVSFDLITCLSVLCAFPPRTARPRLPFRLFTSALNDMVRLLRPGGVLAIYNAQYLVRDAPRAANGLEPWLEACASPSTFVEGFPVFRPDGTVTEERMPLLHRKRMLPPPLHPRLQSLRQRYGAMDGAARALDAASVLHYYCWRGQAFLHSNLHLSGLQVDGFEPDLASFDAARQCAYVNPEANVRIVRRLQDLRPPYDVVTVMTGRFQPKVVGGDEDEARDLDAALAPHVRDLLPLLSGPGARLLLCGPQPSAAPAGLQLEWRQSPVMLACYSPGMAVVPPGTAVTEKANTKAPSLS